MNLRRPSFLTIFLLVLCALPARSHAELAAPHNAANNIGCFNYCHILPEVKSPYWNHSPSDIDDTPTNYLCNSCHTAASGPYSMVNAPRVLTHSSISIDNSYGNWTTECTDCHNPHFQEQLEWINNGETGIFVATGRITKYSYDSGTDKSTLDYDTAISYSGSWNANRLTKKSSDYRRTVLIPDISTLSPDTTGSLSYQVIAVDEVLKKIIVKGNASEILDDVTLPSSFGIIYGQLLRQNVKKHGFAEPVKFFENTATGNGGFTDQSATVFAKGICQVCHTQTKHWSPAALAAGDSHYPNQACSDCHDHASGFKPSCDACHGNPPTVNIARVKDGLVVTPAPTGSNSAGAHAIHVIDYGYSCDTCHYNGMPTTPVEGDNKIQIGFNIIVDDFDNVVAGIPNKKSLDGTGSIYHGQSLAYEGTNNTVIDTTADPVADPEVAFTCENVYCHSSGKTLLLVDRYGTPMYDMANDYPPNYLQSPGVRSLPWNNPVDPQGDDFTCNNCHDAWPRYDKHQTHISRGMTCDLCHYQIVSDEDNDTIFTIADKNRHANGVYDVSPAPTFNIRGVDIPFTLDYIPAPGGGTCMNNSCHLEIGISNPAVWAADPILPIPTDSFHWESGGGEQCNFVDPDNPAKMKSEGIARFGGSIVYKYYVKPFTLSIDWGDGTVENIDKSSFDYPNSNYVTHLYEESYAPGDHPDRKYTISWSVADAEGLTIPDPSPRTAEAVICPQTNAPPEFDWFWAPGPDGNAYDLALTITARDPDYNVGSHSGPATVQIMWADTKIEYQVNLTDTTASFTQSLAGIPFTHIFGTRAIYSVKVSIKDNATESDFVYGPSKRIYVERGGVDCDSNCTYNPPSFPESADPVGLWKFDEGAGAITQDDTINDNDGQLFGGTTWTGGRVNSALSFDGATGYVSIPDSPLHHFGSGSFTIETWINGSSFSSTDNPAEVRWISKSNYCASWTTDPTCKWFVGGIDSNGHPNFSGRGYGDTSAFGYTAPGTITTNNWYHIAYVIDRSGVTAKGFIYINGVNQSGTGFDLTQLSGELSMFAPILLGGTWADFPGKLDQTAIYNRVLSDAEILDHYQNP